MVQYLSRILLTWYPMDAIAASACVYHVRPANWDRRPANFTMNLCMLTTSDFNAVDSSNSSTGVPTPCMPVSSTSLHFTFTFEDYFQQLQDKQHNSVAMQAALINKVKEDLVFTTLAIPVPGNNEVLVKIFACGLCHTDLHIIDGDWRGHESALPQCPGHEGVGLIATLGPGVTSFHVGDRVGLPFLASACGNCEHCNKGWETLCEKIHYRGYNTPGCFQEYVVASVTYVVKIPDTLSFLQAAPLLCAGVTSYKALKELGLIVGSYVAIVGAAGGLGHLGVQIAYAMGFRVIAIDTANKVDSCSALGAEFCFACNSPTLVSDIKARTQGGCDGVLCLAYTSSAFTSSMAMIRKKGTLVCIALPPGNFEMPIFDLVMKCITVKGSLVGTRADMTEVMELGARGKVQCNITKGYIKDINAAIKTLRSGQITGRMVLVAETCSCSCGENCVCIACTCPRTK